MKADQTRRPVGYSTSWQNEALESLNAEAFTPPQRENMYLIAITKAMREFLAEEVENNSYTERRLTEKIEAARTLFSEDRRLLKTLFR